MMLKLLKPLQKCTYANFHSLFRHLPYNFCPSINSGSRGMPTTIFGTTTAKHSKSSADADKDSVGTSTILVQDGLNFQELPLVVRKTNKIPTEDDVPGKILSSDDDDLNTIMKFQNLAKCQTMDEVVSLLNSLQPSEVTSALATFSLTCVNEDYRPDIDSDGDLRDDDSDEFESKQCSLLTPTVVHKLFDIVCQNGKTSHLLQSLQVVVNSDLDLAQDSELFQKLCSTFLLRLNQGKVRLLQLYEFARLLQSIRGDHTTIVDQMWTGISDRSNDITINNLLVMYRMLPVFHRSRNTVLKILEKKTYQLWWQLRVKDVMGILHILIKINKPHRRLITSLTKWTNLNIHLIGERELNLIINGVQNLDHIDSNIVTAIERLVKVKNVNIEEPLLVSQIMQYCQQFRLRSPTILTNVAAYFAANATNLSPMCILNIVKTFGLLNYPPPEPNEFYSKLEEVLQAKFVQFRPDDVIDLLLTCTYIQWFPHTFVKRIFSRHFLDRLSTIQNKPELLKTYNNLKLLDAAMTLECRYYRGPMLSIQNDNKNNLPRDGRILHQVERLASIFGQILGGRANFACNKWLNKLPPSELYCVDFIVHLNTEGKPIPFIERLRVGKRIAVVIHLPEHYCYDSHELTGEQATKIRHLQKLGYSVVQLDYEELEAISCEKELKDLLNRKLFVNFK